MITISRVVNYWVAIILFLKILEWEAIHFETLLNTINKICQQTESTYKNNFSIPMAFINYYLHAKIFPIRVLQERFFLHDTPAKNPQI